MLTKWGRETRPCSIFDAAQPTGKVAAFPRPTFYLAIAKFVQNPAYRIEPTRVAKYVALFRLARYRQKVFACPFRLVFWRRGRDTRFGKFVVLREQLGAVGNRDCSSIACYFVDASCILFVISDLEES